MSALLVFAESAPAQYATPQFDHLSVDQGLSHFSPTCMTQDARGFLWVGTEDGLNRYDGYSFRVYRPLPGDSTSVSGRAISALGNDGRGHLWIGTSSDGLNRYTPATDSFIRYRQTHHSPRSIPDDVVRSMFLDRSGTFWIGTASGLSRYDPAREEFSLMRATGGNSITSIAQAGDGTLWLAGGSGVLHVDSSSSSLIKRYDLATPSKDIEQNILLAAAFDARGTLWVAGIGGLFRYDSEHDRFIRFHMFRSAPGEPGDDAVLALRSDSRGYLWIGTFHKGLSRFDPSANTFDNFLANANDARALDRDRVSCVSEDDAGLLWVGTYRGGLNRYDPRRDAFGVYRSDHAVYAILRTSRGEVLAGCADAGILTTDSLSARLRMLEPRTLLARSFTGRSVLSMKEEKDGTLWIGTGVGLARVNPARTTVKWYRPEMSPGASPQSNEIKSLLIDRDGDVWAGTNGAGLGRYDRKHDIFFWIRHNPADSGSLAGDNIWGLAQSQHGLLWIGTLGGGLSSLDKGTGLMKRYRHDASNPSSLGNDGIYCVAEDKYGTIWVGTFGGGLCGLNVASGEFRGIDERNGLPNGFVKGILSDGLGSLWVSTDRGLARVRIDSAVCRIYREEDGVHNNVFLSGGYYRDENGRMYFGGEGGMTVFSPESLRRNLHPPRMVITAMTVNEKPVRILDPGPGQAPITLTYDQNVFAFDFAAIDFASSDRNICRYMLGGLENDWVESGNRRYARYTHVPPGEYVFRVRGANGDGVWSRDDAVVRVLITGPYWEAWWFRAIAICSLAALVIMAYNYRVNRLLEIDRLRVRIASDLHDDIGSSLTRISLQSDLVREGIDPSAANEYLSNIAATSRELVVTMSDIVWSIDSRNDTVGSLVTRMRDFAAGTLGAKQIECSFTQRGLESSKNIPAAMRESIYLICKEAVSNIARHSGGTAASIVLENGSSGFSMMIADNGTTNGAREREGGHGMKNMKMRAERIGGQLSVECYGGTKIILRARGL